jgi:predicted DNA-binding protein
MAQNDTRFEFKLPAQRRAELDSLADEAGLTASGLVRLAIRRLLEERNAVLKLAGGGNGKH